MEIPACRRGLVLAPIGEVRPPTSGASDRSASWRCAGSPPEATGERLSAAASIRLHRILTLLCVYALM